VHIDNVSKTNSLPRKLHYDELQKVM